MPNTKAVGVAFADPAFDSVQVGSSNAPIAITSSGVLNGAYATTSAASGDTRLSYEKLTFTSTGSGETIRAFSVVTGANAATGGTLAALQLDSDFASGGTWTNASFLRVTNSGTGEVGTFAVMPAVSATGVFRAKVGSPVVTHTIPVVSGGTTYYIMVSTVA
jgi:hypothetical protein